MVIDIPAGDGKIGNLFLQCMDGRIRHGDWISTWWTVDRYICLVIVTYTVKKVSGIPVLSRDVTNLFNGVGLAEGSEGLDLRQAHALDQTNLFGKPSGGTCRGNSMVTRKLIVEG